MGNLRSQRRWAPLLACIALALSGGLARAADVTPPPPTPPNSSPPFGFLDEVTFGFLDHDPMRKKEDGTFDTALEVFTTPVYNSQTGNHLWDEALSPRFNVGAAINDDGRTSFGWAGLAWQFDVYGPIFVEGEFGGSVNDGDAGAGDAHHLGVGSNLAFHEQGGLGYRLTQHVDFIVTVDHISNANLAAHNAGVTDFGARIGYRF